MAIYKGTALVSQIIGKLGTEDFMRWKNKNVVRVSPPVVTDPHSDRQTTVRDALGALAANWRTGLTAAQRTAWNIRALQQIRHKKLPSGILSVIGGNGGKYDGKEAYIADNVRLMNMGESPVDDPPLTGAKPDCPDDIAYSWNSGTGTLSLTWTKPTTVEVTDKLRVWADSQQELFHRQIALAGLVDNEAVDITTVTGAAGATVLLSDIIGSVLILQCDVLRISGQVSEKSSTQLVELTP